MASRRKVAAIPRSKVVATRRKVEAIRRKVVVTRRKVAVAIRRKAVVAIRRKVAVAATHRADRSSITSWRDPAAPAERRHDDSCSVSFVSPNARRMIASTQHVGRSFTAAISTANRFGAM